MLNICSWEVGKTIKWQIENKSGNVYVYVFKREGDKRGTRKSWNKEITGQGDCSTDFGAGQIILSVELDLSF